MPGQWLHWLGHGAIWAQEIVQQTQRFETVVITLFKKGIEEGLFRSDISSGLAAHGDALFSQRYDCGSQLNVALKLIAEEGRGTLLYLRQEGRGIGLINKLRAYKLQDQGADTVEANEPLGFAAGMCNYLIGAQMLGHLGIASVRLMTNNPLKVTALTRDGITVAERVKLQSNLDLSNAHYLRTKASKLWRMLAHLKWQ